MNGSALPIIDRVLQLFLTPMHRLLLVEDDDRLAGLITRYLQRHAFHVTRVANGQDAIEHVANETPQIILLDLGLPDMDGLDACRAVRRAYDGLLCIFSARADDIHQVVGLELGADDYFTKPIEPAVLVARLRAHLRRAHAGGRSEPELLVFGQLSIDPGSRTVQLDSAPIALTTAEFDLLLILARNAGRILHRDALFKGLRGIGFDGMDRSIDARVSRLRRKLGDLDTDPMRIRTVRGRGYLFNASGWQ
ncbi:MULTISPECIES: response regulator [unclassified Stenotrophomonas]|uniref:response regulator n=1 Tax=unclassified Stenotrophomonas TaxID=196198 RepID=UPI002D7FFBF4|nr:MULTISPECIES: response regulator [unclassified Stenotrophomonas]